VEHEQGPEKKKKKKPGNSGTPGWRNSGEEQERTMKPDTQPPRNTVSDTTCHTRGRR